MSGHSHYATIHRQKEINDSARGNVFSKMARAITIAVKSGGGPNPQSNFKLRVEMDRARAVNMPKENVERAIAKATGGGETLDEAVYEGFGPAGLAVIVEAATDNRNRTGQELKNIFERAGGRLAGPGAVSFNFEQKGLLVVQKEGDYQDQMLKLIDSGVEDLEETDDAIEAYVPTPNLMEVKQRLEDGGFKIKSYETTQRPKTFQNIQDVKDAEKALSFLDTLNDHEDVQKVYANLDIPSEILSQLKS